MYQNVRNDSLVKKNFFLSVAFILCIFLEIDMFSVSLFRRCDSGRRRMAAIQSFINTPPELVRLSSPLSESVVSVSEHEISRSIIDRCEKIHQLRLDRMELLSLPAHSVSTRNKELAALGVGAVSGALSLSFHPAFALIFIVSYRMYKKANRPTETRLRSPEKVKEINQEILSLSDANAKDLLELKNSIS